MEEFVKGDVVVTFFPFTDMSAIKKRPALVVADLKGENIILCQITTKKRRDGDKIELSDSDFVEGNLDFESFIMPSIIFTSEKAAISYRLGKLKKEKISEVENKVCEIFTR